MTCLLHSGLPRNGQGEIATCGIFWALSKSLELCAVSEGENSLYMESTLHVGRSFDPPELTLASVCAFTIVILISKH